MRRYGKPPKPGQLHRNRPGAYAIILAPKGVLLTHQSSPVSEIQLPGGGIDPGETVLQALHREVLEETGWRINVVRRLGAYQRYSFMPEYDLYARKVCNIYFARAIRKTDCILEKHHTALWMDPSLACDSVASSGDASFLRTFLRT